jgi:predicted NBD/HSP70 family sugar kinase
MAHRPADILAYRADRGQGPAHGDGANHGCRVLRELRRAAAQSIAFAVNLLDPEAVILGGGGDVYVSVAERAMRAQV